MEGGLFEQARAGWGRWRSDVGGRRGAVGERSGKVRWVEGSSPKPGWEGSKSIGGDDDVLAVPRRSMEPYSHW